MPQYGGFPPPAQCSSGQFYPGMQPVGTHAQSQPSMVSRTASTPTAVASRPQIVSPSKLVMTAQSKTEKAKRPANTSAQANGNRPPPQLVNLLQQDKHRPATTTSTGQHGAQILIGHTRVASTPPVQAPNRLNAPTLSSTQQTQVMPAAMHNSTGTNGGRRHWPLELWVVRHGETIENNTRVIAGQNGSGLTENGQEQASLLAQRVQDVKFAGIYISDLNRTKQTADAVLRAMGPGRCAPAFTDSRLREKGAGQYEGYKIGHIEQMTRASGQAHRVFRPPGGESWEDVARRSRSFMREILTQYCSDVQERPSSHRGHDNSGRSTLMGNAGATAPVEPKRILVVTHGGFISEFLSSAVGGVPNCAKNCSIFVLACAREHPQARAEFFLKTVNEVSHVR